MDYADVSPRQMVSVATAMIPFLEHDDANRALMVPTCSARRFRWCAARLPLVGTGMELRAAIDAGDVVVADKAGVVKRFRPTTITVMDDDGTRPDVRMRKFNPVQPRHLRQPEADRGRGQRVEPARSSPTVRTENGEMALGRTCSWPSCRGRAQLRGRHHPSSAC